MATSVNCKQIYTDNPEITFGEIIESYFVPAFRGELGKAEYKLGSDGYPYIVLPWADGTISDDYNVVLKTVKTATTLVSTQSGNVRVDIGLMDMKSNAVSTASYPIAGWGSGSTGGTALAIYFQSSVVFIDALSYGYAYDLGMWTAGDENLSLIARNAIITTMKTVSSDTPVNGLIVLPFGTNNKYLNLLYSKNGNIVNEWIDCWQLPTQKVSANMYQLNDGIVYHDRFYVCFPHYHEILRQLTVCDRASGTPYSMWSQIVHIGGKKFSLHINAGNGTSGDSYVTLAEMKD